MRSAKFVTKLPQNREKSARGTNFKRAGISFEGGEGEFKKRGGLGFFFGKGGIPPMCNTPGDVTGVPLEGGESPPFTYCPPLSKKKPPFPPFFIFCPPPFQN